MAQASFDKNADVSPHKCTRFFFFCAQPLPMIESRFSPLRLCELHARGRSVYATLQCLTHSLPHSTTLRYTAMYLSITSDCQIRSPADDHSPVLIAITSSVLNISALDVLLLGIVQQFISFYTWVVCLSARLPYA
jgi:hypothetical protein